MDFFGPNKIFFAESSLLDPTHFSKAQFIILSDMLGGASFQSLTVFSLFFTKPILFESMRKFIFYVLFLFVTTFLHSEESDSIPENVLSILNVMESEPSFLVHKKLSKLGFIEADYNLGLEYFFAGKVSLMSKEITEREYRDYFGVPASRYFKSAADSGHIEASLAYAQYLLALMGENNFRNIFYLSIAKKIEKYLTYAAENDNAVAQLVLHRLLWDAYNPTDTDGNSTGGTIISSEGTPWLIKSFLNDNFGGTTDLFTLIISKQKPFDDLTEKEAYRLGFDILKIGADGGDAYSQFTYGMMAVNSTDEYVKKTGLDYLKKASEQGHHEAKALLDSLQNESP